MQSRDPQDLVGALDRWARSDAMQRLAAASGWTWPEGPTDTVVDELARRSADWNFRQKVADGGERHALTSIRAEIGGKVVGEELVRSAAAELGLAGGRPITGGFTHVVVLGGMVRACLNRTREAARRRDELGVERVVVLTAHRPLAGAEPADAEGLGWGPLALESEAAVAAAVAVFGLAEAPDDVTERWWDGDDGELPEGVEPDEWRRRRSSAEHRWRTPGLDVEVVVAPSREPATRRTNTADQLVFWAERAGIGDADRLLLVTTDHYVPAQHFDAIRVLGLPFGCGVETCGVEWVPTGPYQGAAYLQEVRSALLAASRLLAAVAPGTEEGTGQGTSRLG
jgi:hypothetical protein